MNAQKFVSACVIMLIAGLSQAAEKNIIFFITDDESPTLRWYGDEVAVTPSIDA